jgi:NADPH-dependent curcumin reductase CurA
MVSQIGLAEAPEAAAKLMAGQVRGRYVVKIG